MKEKLLELMEQVYQETRALVADLSDAERAAPSTPKDWSAKDHIAHNIEWAQRFYNNLAGIAQPALPGSDEDQQNAFIYEKYRSQSWAEILTLGQQVYQDMAAQLQNLSDEDLLVPNRLSQQNNRPLWSMVVSNFYTHPLVHLGYICMAHHDPDRLVRLNEEAAKNLVELDVTPSWQGTILYNLACSYALAGDHTKALSFLTQALHFEPQLMDWSKQDPDLASLHDDPEFQAIYGQ